MIQKSRTKILAVFVFTICAAEIFPQTGTYATASLLRNSYAAKTDSSLELGIQINLEQDWHIYWRNPGDSGIPTDFEWDLPEGFRLPKIFWPIPKFFEFNDFVSYGFDKRVLFIAELEIPQTFKQENIEISVKLKSLICKNICVPFNSSFTLKVDLSRDYLADEETKKAFIQTKQILPNLDKDLKASARMYSDIVILDVYNPAKNASGIEKVYFIPYQNGIFKNTIQQKIVIIEDYLSLKIEPESFRSKNPKYLFGILVFENINDSADIKSAYEINVPIMNLH